jgi:peptidoglycan/LPS O-acetylase OafA/YrhL
MTDSSPHLSHPKYRPDIDGLRAIAVLSVVAFHAFPSWLKGGFIGVDIFFVISGYLISTIIFESLDKGTFSFSEFYARRICRIFPALLLVMFASYTFGWFALLADEYQQLGKHIATGSIFASNITLWSEAGYFDMSAEIKPLLHLWSLGIEEQFYIAWPILLYIIWKQKINLLAVIIILWIISFYLNIEGVKTDPIATFYSPQTRFWELLCGSLLAWITIYKASLIDSAKAKIEHWLSAATCREKPDTNNTLSSNIISCTGLVLLACGILSINSDSEFPGKLALIPTLGTVLIIMAGSKAWINRRILSNKFAVWVGLISFPLYLWHWPLLSFARIIEGDTPNRNTRIVMVLTAIILAWLTYRFIERPIRLSGSNKFTVMSLALIMSCTGGIGYITYKNNGFEFRTAHQNHKEYSALDWSDFKSQGCEQHLGSSTTFCIEYGSRERQEIAIIGDSTGNSLAPGLARLAAQHDLGLVNFGSWTCPPIRGLVETKYWGKGNSCVATVENSYRRILEAENIHTVVLAIFARDLKSWGIPGLQADAPLEKKFDVIKRLLDEDIKALKAKGKNVIVTYDTPLNPFEARHCAQRPLQSLKNHICESDEKQLIDRQPYLSLFENFFTNRPDICIVRQSNVFNHNGKFRISDEAGRLLFRDTHHLTYYGSDLVAKEFIKSGCLSLTNPGAHLINRQSLMQLSPSL